MPGIVPEVPVNVPCVVMLQLTVELPLPALTEDGLTSHVARFGSPEQAKLTSFGKVPLVGLKVRLKVAICPAEMEVSGGEALIVKSKPPLAVDVNVTGAECVVDSASLPVATMSKL